MLRHISSACGDTSVPSIVPATLPSLSSNLVSGVQNNAAQQVAAAYALFLRQLQVNAAIMPTLNSLGTGFAAPYFPSYVLPSINSYQVDLTKPDSSHQIFGGLMSDPQLRSLLSVKPRTGLLAPLPVEKAIVSEVSAATLTLPAGGINVSKF